MLLPISFALLAGVISNVCVADVIATYYSTKWWLMLLPGGRCNGHCRVVVFRWLMLLPQADVIAMGHDLTSVSVLRC